MASSARFSRGLYECSILPQARFSRNLFEMLSRTVRRVMRKNGSPLFVRRTDVRFKPLECQLSEAPLSLPYLCLGGPRSGVRGSDVGTSPGQDDKSDLLFCGKADRHGRHADRRPLCRLLPRLVSAVRPLQQLPVIWQARNKKETAIRIRGTPGATGAAGDKMFMFTRVSRQVAG